MPTTPEGFSQRIGELKADLALQGRRVQHLLEAAFNAAFARDVIAAKRAMDLDDEVDKVDVELEKRAVSLLSDATSEGAALGTDQLRLVLTIVKVNNELERIADVGVRVGEIVEQLVRHDVHVPDTFRIMTNSVIGILRDSCTSLDRNDGRLAKIVLASEEAVEGFKRAVLRDCQVQVSSGRMTVDAAFLIQEIASCCELTASHCTNIAEQALYVASGTIVRHMQGQWEEIRLPPSGQ